MLQDGRLVISGIAVGVAMFALVWDYFYNFPLSRPVLIGCVTTYFILMAIHTLYTTFKEKGIFVVVMQKDPAGMDPDSTWEAASNMKKYDDKYELVLTYVDGKTGARRESTVIKSVGDYIDENGVICLDILEVNVKCFVPHHKLIIRQDVVIMAKWENLLLLIYLILKVKIPEYTAIQFIKRQSPSRDNTLVLSKSNAPFLLQPVVMKMHNSLSSGKKDK